MNPDGVILVRKYLQRWNEIYPSSQLRLTHGSAGEQGVVADDVAELEKLRQFICDTIGIVVPMVSFYLDMKTRMAYATAAAQGTNGDR